MEKPEACVSIKKSSHITTHIIDSDRERIPSKRPPIVKRGGSQKPRIYFLNINISEWRQTSTARLFHETCPRPFALSQKKPKQTPEANIGGTRSTFGPVNSQCTAKFSITMDYRTRLCPRNIGMALTRNGGVF